VICLLVKFISVTKTMILQILQINVKTNYFVLLFNVSRLGSRYNYNLYINYLIYSQKENYTVDERTNLAIT